VGDDADLEAWANAYIEVNSVREDVDSDHPSWWAVNRATHCIRREHAEELWRFILIVLGKRPNDFVLEVLAAGPLEELIAYDGKDFIDRIEAQAEQDPAFKDLLGGVWEHGTPEEIWVRIERCRGGVW
jgi:hypothetical protein